MFFICTCAYKWLSFKKIRKWFRNVRKFEIIIHRNNLIKSFLLLPLMWKLQRNYLKPLLQLQKNIISMKCYDFNSICNWCLLFQTCWDSFQLSYFSNHCSSQYHVFQVNIRLPDIGLGAIYNTSNLNWLLHLYINLACLSVCLFVCLFVCLYPINVKTAEPIGSKFLWDI